MKPIACLLLMMLVGCAAARPVSPAMTFLHSLKHYREEVLQLPQTAERWPDRQLLGEWLKAQYRIAIGKSADFDQLVDLNYRRREFLIVLRDPSLSPQRAREIKEELGGINKTIDGLKEAVESQVANVELRAQQQSQAIETVAALGLLKLGLEGFAAADGGSRSSIPVGQHVVTDGGSFSTVRTPEGQTYDCSTVLLADGAGITCKLIGN